MPRPKSIVCYSCGSKENISQVDKTQTSGKYLLKYGIEMICETCLSEVHSVEKQGKYSFFQWLEDHDSRDLQGLINQEQLRKYFNFKGYDSSNLDNYLDSLEEYCHNLENTLSDYFTETGSSVQDFLRWKESLTKTP